MVKSCVLKKAYIKDDKLSEDDIKQGAKQVDSLNKTMKKCNLVAQALKSMWKVE